MEDSSSYSSSYSSSSSYDELDALLDLAEEKINEKKLKEREAQLNDASKVLGSGQNDACFKGKDGKGGNDDGKGGFGLSKGNVVDCGESYGCKEGGLSKGGDGDDGSSEDDGLGKEVKEDEFSKFVCVFFG